MRPYHRQSRPKNVNNVQSEDSANTTGVKLPGNPASPVEGAYSNPVRLNWVAFQTIVRKEIRRFLRIWIQTITPPAINAVLYLLIFGGLIGSRIRDMGGVPYLDFIMPGIIMMGIIINSYANVSSSFFSAKFQRNIEEMLVSPVSNLTILAGFITGGVCRGLMVGVVVSVVALGITRIFPVNIFLTLLVAVMTAVLFSLGGFINAVYARNFDEISIIPNFVLTPLTYLGGIFYSISLLPEFWQGVSRFNPVLYMVNGFRYGILGVSDIPILQTFVVLLAFIIVLALIAAYLLNKGIGIKN